MSQLPDCMICVLLGKSCHIFNVAVSICSSQTLWPMYSLQCATDSYAPRWFFSVWGHITGRCYTGCDSIIYSKIYVNLSLQWPYILKTAKEHRLYSSHTSLHWMQVGTWCWQKPMAWPSHGGFRMQGDWDSSLSSCFCEGSSEGSAKLMKIHHLWTSKGCSRNYPGGRKHFFVLWVEGVLLTMCPRGGGWGGNLSWRSRCIWSIVGQVN